MGRSVNPSPCFSWALRALPGENKDPDSRDKCRAGKTRPSRLSGSRRSAFVGVEIGEVGLALLGLHILARRRARTGDRRRMCALAEIAQDALDGTWLGDGSDDAHSGVTARRPRRRGAEDPPMGGGGVWAGLGPASPSASP